jgi:hypothetical protein
MVDNDARRWLQAYLAVHGVPDDNEPSGAQWYTKAELPAAAARALARRLLAQRRMVADDTEA